MSRHLAAHLRIALSHEGWHREVATTTNTRLAAVYHERWYEIRSQTHKFNIKRETTVKMSIIFKN